MVEDFVLLVVTVLRVEDFALLVVTVVLDDDEVLDLILDELVTFELVVDDDLRLLVLLTDFAVDVEVVLEDEGRTELDVDEVEMCTDDELELATVEPSVYISSRFPAPQYS